MADAPLIAHQAKLLAHELTLKRAADDSQKLTTALMDAQVDLNPHQVDAALFAFKSPLSNGAILADEVGLGKTIEAGLVMTQKWAEGRRRLLVICPASLRPQWRDELAEKFFLPAQVIESRSYNAAVKSGITNPFASPGKPTVLICSFHFAAGKAEDLLATPWDMVVIDEAHRVRNVYKPDNKIGRAIRGALHNVPKVLLTATPLQNSLLELHGLVSFIDEHAFGDVKSFRSRYSRVTNEQTFNDLKSRLAPLCHRTLRRQVSEYVKFTNRIPLTQEFRPTPEEQVLYDLVSEYLRRPSLFALPASQRSLITLILRKLLASSTFAIAGGLNSIAGRLRRMLRNAERARASTEAADLDELLDDLDHAEALTDEWVSNAETEPEPGEAPLLTDEEMEALGAELQELEALRDRAVSITENARGQALLSALGAAFDKGQDLGAPQKAVIFTESRRTQDYLVRVLSANGYGDDLVLFNGSNNDDRAREIYRIWKEEHAGSDRVTGARTADVRSALVDEFRNNGRIMIATEAAAEGINLQFCSIVVNYDLPWNPQRIEQRIGRCHRYGQAHDVVVVNFLNRDNAADQRVFELLNEKFNLFSGVFGASDEVLGAIESGVDIERRIVDIYQRCRLPEEIDEEFTQLQLDLDEQISAVMADTRQKLLENFDAEVHDRLRVNLALSRESVDRAELALWRITHFILDGHAEFDGSVSRFRVRALPPEIGGAEPGDRFHIGASADNTSHKYRVVHPLAESVISAAKRRETAADMVAFGYSTWSTTAVALEQYVGQAGWLVADKLTISGVEPEEHLLISAVTDDGQVIDADAARRLLDVPATATDSEGDVPAAVDDEARARRLAVLDELEARHAVWFDRELEKFDRWAEDQRHALRAELKDLDSEIRELKRAARTAGSLPEKLAAQRKIRDLEAKRDSAWRSYDAAARDVEAKKDELLDQVEARLATDTSVERLFTIRWSLT